MLLIMSELGLNELFTIAQASPVLDQVEAELTNSGKEMQARALHKLQADAGVQIDREMSGFDENEPAVAPGPETARLNAAYEPVTVSRLDLLGQVQESLSTKGLKDSVGELIQELNLTDIPLSPVTKPPEQTPEI